MNIKLRLDFMSINLLLLFCLWWWWFIIYFLCTYLSYLYIKRNITALKTNYTIICCTGKYNFVPTAKRYGNKTIVSLLAIFPFVLDRQNDGKCSSSTNFLFLFGYFFHFLNSHRSNSRLRQ